MFLKIGFIVPYDTLSDPHTFVARLYQDCNFHVVQSFWMEEIKTREGKENVHYFLQLKKNEDMYMKYVYHVCVLDPTKKYMR